jgi:DNA-binding transcriptional LysR family regulator
MLDPRRLRLLVEFDRRGTVAAVASALSYTPSAVSQQLAVLEREAGVQLFEHVGRRMILTEVGRMLVGHSTEVLGAIERAEADLERATGELSGIVRLASIASLGMTLIPDVISAIEERHPGLMIEFRDAEQEDTFPWLDAGEVDLVVAFRYETHPSGTRYDERVLGRDPMFVALPEGHPLASCRAVSLAQLADSRWVGAPSGSAYDDWLLRTCRKAGFEPDIRHRSDTNAVVVGLVAAGAVAITSAIVWPEARSGTVQRPISGVNLEREFFSAARSSSAQRPAIVALREALADAWDGRQPPTGGGHRLRVKTPTHRGSARRSPRDR